MSEAGSKDSEMPYSAHRYYFMDAMRGILMTLGVVLHSALVYDPHGGWIIHSPVGSHFSSWLVTVIHTFRIPAFFMVSGFFCLRSLNKYGVARFLKLRGERILVPLLVTAATINCLQAYLLDLTGWRPLDWKEFVGNGKWVEHLWFLTYLLVFYLIMCLWKGWLQLPARFVSFLGGRLDKANILSILFLLPLSYLMLLAAGKVMPQLYDSPLGLFSLFDLLFYFQFFAFGACLGWRSRLLANFSGCNVLAVAAALSAALVIGSLSSDEGTTAALLIHRYTNLLTTWLSCSLCFSFFMAVANKPSTVMSFFANASYSIYLFHHILVIALGMLFIRWGIGAQLGLPLMIITVFSASACIHLFIVSRSDLLSYLFNGKRKALTGIQTVQVSVKPQTGPQPETARSLL